MTHFMLDASALAKRYVPEPGSHFLDTLFDVVGIPRLRCLTIGAAEAFSVILRHRNRGTLSAADANAAVASLYAEVILNEAFETMPAPDAVVFAAIALIERHNLNTADALALRAGIELRDVLKFEGNTLVLVASDARFLRAAAAEGFATFDPESGDTARLEALAQG